MCIVLILNLQDVNACSLYCFIAESCKVSEFITFHHCLGAVYLKYSKKILQSYATFLQYQLRLWNRLTENCRSSEDSYSLPILNFAKCKEKIESLSALFCTFYLSHWMSSLIIIFALNSYTGYPLLMYNIK